MREIADYISVVASERDFIIGQMGDPGWIMTDDRPLKAELLGNEGVRAVGLKAADDSRPSVKAIALMEEGSGTRTGYEARTGR